MNTETQPSPGPEFPVPLLSPAQLGAPSCKATDWLWHGYLASGMLTAFTSQGKSGKTTLASILLARLKAGGELAGLSLRAARAVVVTEESRATWDERCHRLGIEEEYVRFLVRPFRGVRPSVSQWQSFVTNLTRLHQQEPFGLLMIDPLAGFLPGGAENYAPAMLDFLLPLQMLAEAGPATWLLHHPAKGKHADGAAGRGTSALAGFADILIEMSCVKRLRSPDRRRRLRAYSRKDETPRHLVIELNAAGTDYSVAAARVGEAANERSEEVEAILANAYTKHSQEELLEQWPTDRVCPNRTTLYRWLRAAVEAGRVSCEGTGTRGDPFRYWLPERVSMLHPGSNASAEEMQAWNDRFAKELFAHIDRHQARQGNRPAGGAS
jgi:hypothetical protein